VSKATDKETPVAVAEPPAPEPEVVPETVPAEPVAAPKPLAELKTKVDMWNSIEPAKAGDVTDAQSRADVEAHLREIAAKYGEAAGVKARNIWNEEHAKGLAGYLSALVSLLAAWSAVVVPEDPKDDALRAKYAKEDREATEAVDNEILALSRHYGETSEVVEEARRLWNNAQRMGRKK